MILEFYGSVDEDYHDFGLQKRGCVSYPHTTYQVPRVLGLGEFALSVLLTTRYSWGVSNLSACKVPLNFNRDCVCFLVRLEYLNVNTST